MQDVLQRAGSRWSAPPIPVPQTTSSSPSSVTQSVTQDSITIQSHGTHVLTDPVGDTFGTVASFCADSFPPTAPPPGDCVNVVHPVMPDLTGMEMVLQSDQTLRITMTFKDPVVAWFSSTSPNLVLGFIDLDVDQNPATGIFPLTDGNNRSGSGATGMGTDYFISLFNFGYSDREGLAFVYKADISELTVIPTLFDGNQILMAVPLTLMGNDDGQVDFAAVVGTLAEPTDVIPNDGHGTLKKPAETIADLMALLNTCEAELKNAGMFEFLMNMLAAAEKFRAQGDLDKAIKKIEDFIKKLDPFAPSPAAVSLAQGSGGATPLSLSECAEKLIANAQNVLTNLEQEKKDRVKVVPNNPVPLPNKTYDPDNPASKDSFPEDIQKGLKKFKAVTFPFYSAMPKVTHSSGVEAKGNKFVAKGSAVTVQVPLSLTIQKYLPDNANDVLLKTA